MWLTIALFEMNYRRKHFLFYVSCAILFTLGLIIGATDLGPLMSTQKNMIQRNAPFVIYQSQVALTMVGMFLVTAFVADAGQRDFQKEIHMLFFSKPISKWEYLGGRFIGSTLMCLFAFLFPILGFIAAYFVPWQDPSLIGAFSLTSYVMAYLTITVPNILFTSAIFFAVAVHTRRLLPVYLCVVAFIFAQEIAETMSHQLENGALGTLLEPFGVSVLGYLSRYWTLNDFNSHLPELGGPLLYNRLVWLAVSGFFLLFVLFKFDYARASAPPARKKVKKQVTPTQRPILYQFQLPTVSLTYASIPMLLRQTLFEIRIIFHSRVFIVIGVITLGFITWILDEAGSIRQTPSLPVTSLMVSVVGKFLKLMLPIVTIIYSGELVWRERAGNQSGIEDTLPLPNGSFMIAKFLAIVTAVSALVMICFGLAFIHQSSQEFSYIQYDLYLKGFASIVFPMMLLTALAIFCQVISSNKFVGYLMVLAIFIAATPLRSLGIDYLWFSYASLPPLVFSEMNGYGHFFKPYFWYGLYWSCFAILLITISINAWPRGTEVRFVNKFKRMRMNGLSMLALGLAASCFVGCRWYIKKESANHHTAHQQKSQLANYEIRYGSYGDLPLPQIESVSVALDLFPKKRTANIRGSYVVRNNTDQIIQQLPITLSPRFEEGFAVVDGGVSLNRFEANGRAIVEDKELGFYVYELNEPLEIGMECVIEFEVAVDQNGFPKQHANYQIVDNGSFFTNTNFLPQFGYMKSNQLKDSQSRKDHNLDPYHHEDEPHRNYLNGDWIQLEATVSTDLDQTAITSGTLVKSWEKDERRYFQYKSEAPMQNLFAFFSARYEVQRQQHGDVSIELYYHPTHKHNIERYFEATKATLDYCHDAFGPYPHKELRIVEMPSYNGQLAISLAGVIGTSESWGFYAAEGGVDPVWGITAHEIAHQWWNHQVTPASALGATFIAETLCEYTATNILEQKFGSDITVLKRKYDLDSYLRLRQSDSGQEMPLAKVNNQGHIHYHKGVLAMSALKETLGEKKLNHILRQFLEEYRFSSQWPLAEDLLQRFRTELGEDHPILEDMFDTVSLFDNRIKLAEASQQDQHWQLTLELETKKLSPHGQGQEQQRPMNQRIKVAVYDKDNRELLKEPLSFTQDQTSIQLTMPHQPALVVLDPDVIFIDRDRKDNSKSVTIIKEER